MKHIIVNRTLKHEKRDHRTYFVHEPIIFFSNSCLLFVFTFNSVSQKSKLKPHNVSQKVSSCFVSYRQKPQ